MSLSNNNIYRVLRDTYDQHVHNVMIFEDKHAAFNTLKQTLETLQARIKQSDMLVGNLTTQAIEESIHNNAIPFLNGLQSRTSKPLMLQAQPMTDTVWMVAVLASDLFNKVAIPTDRPLKVWVFDPKQRLGLHYDIHEQLLRTGTEMPGIDEESGMLAQFSIDILTGDLVYQSIHTTHFQKPQQPAPQEIEAEVVSEQPIPDTSTIDAEYRVEDGAESLPVTDDLSPPNGQEQ